MSLRAGNPGVSVAARPADPVAFAAFGAFLRPPATVGDRAQVGAWLEPVPGRVLHGHLNRVAPAGSSLSVDTVERHPHASQVFVPVGVSRYLVLVMPSDGTGAPDPARAEAFVVPGTTGVAYHPGTWHAGISVLDEEGSFFVAMWRGGEDDDVVVSVPPIEVTVPDPASGEPGRRGGSNGVDHG